MALTVSIYVVFRHRSYILSTILCSCGRFESFRCGVFLCHLELNCESSWSIRYGLFCIKCIKWQQTYRLDSSSVFHDHSLSTRTSYIRSIRTHTYSCMQWYAFLLPFVCSFAYYTSRDKTRSRAMGFRIWGAHEV